MRNNQEKNNRIISQDDYNQSSYKKAVHMRVRIEDDLDSAGSAFAVEILRALQFWQDRSQIGIHLCTGDSPFIGYRKIGGDRLLEKRGRYHPEESAQIKQGCGRITAILDTWDAARTRSFLKNNNLDPNRKPDMSKVVVFAIDALFPQQRSDYFAFSNLLNNVCDLWGVPKQNRHLFYGDVYVAKHDKQWQISEIPDAEYTQLINSITCEGLKILEYQAACLADSQKRGFALNSSLQIKNGTAFGTRLKRSDNGDFQAEELKICPLDVSHNQYKYLESMHNQALMMHEKLIEFPGARVTLLGVGPSYTGQGHIGFCEKGTPYEQTCFMGSVNDFDATFHIAGAHAKEFCGFKNMFVTAGGFRMPKFGFITYGPAELMHQKQETIVIVIATGNLKSSSVAKAIEGDVDLNYPLSLTQECRGVYVLDKTAARSLHLQQCSQETISSDLLPKLSRPKQIPEKLYFWNVEEKDTILLVNPHMDDDFLAMMHVLKEMTSHYNVHACYTSGGYTAVYTDYILGLLDVAASLDQKDRSNLCLEARKDLLKELVKEKKNLKPVPYLDYDVLSHMSEQALAIRAKLLLIDLEQRYDLSPELRQHLSNKFKDGQDILRLREFLAEAEYRKSHGTSGQDLDIMRFLKTSSRFMETASSLMYLGLAFENIYWPLDVSFYGTLGRPKALDQKDIGAMKELIKTVGPKMVVFNGEGFPDFNSHSNTEIGTYIALSELSSQGALNKDLVLLRWAGVWDRIRIQDAQLSVVLTKQELEDFHNAFNYFYPTQAPYAPVLNASSACPQSFAQDVIMNASRSAKEILESLDIPADIVDIFKKGGGALNYKLAKLTDSQTQHEFLNKQKVFERVRASVDASNNAALLGPAPYPEELYEISKPLISKMLAVGAISEKEKGLFGYGEAFTVSVSDMIKVVNSFQKEMEKGLTGDSSSLAMLPTFVGNPTGKEKGLFLALDLGGSTIRILMVHLAGGSKNPEVVIEKYNLKASEQEQAEGISYDYTKGSQAQLFAAIAENIRKFLETHQKHIANYSRNKPYSLGFTFSFPVRQVSIGQAIFKKWAKEFHITDIIDKDVVGCLQDALEKEGLSGVVNVVSLNNDTVGTLIAKRYHDANCDLGGIMGTGTNFCYIEDVENIHMLTDEARRCFNREKMVINIESGNFDKIVQNTYDRIIDADSSNKGEQKTEKMVSGLYLGELTRQVMVDLAAKGLLFKDKLTQEEINLISQKESFPTPFITKIAEDNSSSFDSIHAQLLDWGIKQEHITYEDKRVLKQLCIAILRRAARVSASIVFAIISHIDNDIANHHTVAMDGSLFEKYSAFKTYMQEALNEISVEFFSDLRCNNIYFELSSDGSGVGAAIIAHQVSK